MSREPWVTIHDVARRMGLELSNEQAWSIGAKLAHRWAGIMEKWPVKDNRRKKAGTGSHCFALYPPTWVPLIEDEILACHAQAARQLDMFAHAPAAP